MKNRICCGRCRCRSFSFIGMSPYGKPRFRCDGCGETWSCGRDGGDYLVELKRRKKLPEGWETMYPEGDFRKETGNL